ncbi:MAG: ABC-F family ATP-binding cassette domain-containing protein [Bacteroidota bacterium]
MITISNLTIRFSERALFENITFVIGDKDRIGLVGHNGAGKSTLMKLIAGRQKPEEGNVIYPTDNTIGYLPQEMASKSDKTVFDEALTAFDEIHKLEKEINYITNQLSERSDYESIEYLKLIENLEHANHRFHLFEGFNIEAQTEKILTGLGFDRNDLTRKMREFSGGWQMRVELAKILLKKPDIILLDEPTNHLDIESIQWLENYLQVFEGAVMLVSHDRAFLDNVTTRTVEITSGKIYDYKTSYSEYIVLQQERIENQMAQLSGQQRQMQDTLKFIERFRYKATKSRQVQSKIKMIEKVELIRVDERDDSTINFSFPPAPHAGKIAVEAQLLCKAYGEKEILKNLDFIIDNGDKVAFVGRNGEGKTTLSKIIVGDTDISSGICRTGHQIKIGYYAQNQDELLNHEKTVFQIIDDVAVGDIRKKIRGILGSFLFGEDDIDKKVKVLSGGEKSRLALAKLLLEPVNLLVLDEPTNHLDMRSKDILKRALMEYDGTMLIVSHDRDFLQGLTNKVFEFKNKVIRQIHGDVYDFLETRKIEHLNELNAIAASNAINPKEEIVSQNKQSYEDRKLFDKEIRKIKNKISEHEEIISKLETKLEEINKHLSEASDQIDNQDIFLSYDRCKKELENKMYEWELMQMEVEEKEKMR